MSDTPFFKKDFIFLVLERGEGQEKGRETQMCGCLSHAPYWGPDLQSRHVLLMGIEPVILWFTGRHWAPARSGIPLLMFMNNDLLNVRVLVYFIKASIVIDPEN